MSPVTLSSVFLIALTLGAQVHAQLDPAVTKPLAQKRFQYPNGIPEKVDTDVGTVRGPQAGYNKCDSTTEGSKSMCQTATVNHLDDFCLWAPSTPNSAISDTEGIEVAWCTRPGRGTRVIPQGALTGLQFIKTPAYLAIVGYLKGPLLNIKKGDSGGELDPHGADLRGNPLGGLMYSNGFPSNLGNNNTYQQVVEWHNFMGDGQFCIKVCDPTNRNAAKFCQHIYDRIGCAYNVPNNAADGVFEKCEGDVQDYPGIYTEAGVVKTYTQPAESLGVISTIPFQPRVPASSKCVQYRSADLLDGLAPAPTGSAGPIGKVSSISSSSASSTALPSSSSSLVTLSKSTTRTTSALPSATGNHTSSASQTVKMSGAISLVGAAAVAILLS